MMTTIYIICSLLIIIGCIMYFCVEDYESLTINLPNPLYKKGEKILIGSDKTTEYIVVGYKASDLKNFPVKYTFKIKRKKNLNK